MDIPIAVKEHDNVGRDQVDPETSCSGRQQEDELVAPGLVVFVDGLGSSVVIGSSIDTAVLCCRRKHPCQRWRSVWLEPEHRLTVSSELAVVFQDVQHSTHLRENQDTRTLLHHSLQKSIENPHFIRVVNQVLVRGIRWTGFL